MVFELKLNFNLKLRCYHKLTFTVYLYSSRSAGLSECPIDKQFAEYYE